jgi:hypothetical protein
MKYLNSKTVLLSQIQLLKSELSEASRKAKFYEIKWKQARKHLREANKGAERNAIALELSTFKLNHLRKLTIEKINEENSKEETKI